MNEMMDIRIVTEQTVTELIRKSRRISIVRSGQYNQVGTCVEDIMKICAEAKERKEIRIILPSLNNPDVKIRARAVGKPEAEIRAQLAAWHEALASAGAAVAPRHSLELRLTEEPHRYHAFLSETEAIVGFAWHFRAALGTASIGFGEETAGAVWALDKFSPDFEALWKQAHPYNVGDNKKIRIAPNPPNTIVEKILATFGDGRPNIVRALKFLKPFPNEDGNGAVPSLLASQLGGHKADWNDRLKEMECAGLVRKIADEGRARPFGRILTGFGVLVLAEIDRNGTPNQFDR